MDYLRNKDDFVQNALDIENNEPPKPTKKELKALKKAQLKEKKRLEALQDKRIIIRDQLERELELSKKTAEKLNEKWTDVMEKIKIEELKSEIVSWNMKFERNLKQKDSLVQLLLNDMEQTEELHNRCYLSHMNAIEYLYDTFNALSNSHKELYEKEATNCLREFFEEIHEYQSAERVLLENIENIELNQCLLTENELWEDFQIYVRRMDEQILKEIERRYENRDFVVERMKIMYNQLSNYVNELKNVSTDERKYERIRQLTEKQEYFKQQTERLDSYEFRVGRIFFELQRELLYNDVESQRKITNLNLEHTYFTNVFERLDQEREWGNKLTMERMKVLASESRKVLEYFRKLERKGELLLSLAASCRKFQTESEKVVVLHNQSELHTSSNDSFSLAAINLMHNSNISPEDLNEHLELMHLFYKRIALVQHQNILLKREKNQLEAENRALIESFKKLNRTVDVDEIEKTVTVYNLSSDGVSSCHS